MGSLGVCVYHHFHSLWVIQEEKEMIHVCLVSDSDTFDTYVYIRYMMMSSTAALGSIGFLVFPLQRCPIAISRNNLHHTTARAGTRLQPVAQLPDMHMIIYGPTMYSYNDCRTKASLVP